MQIGRYCRVASVWSWFSIFWACSRRGTYQRPSGRSGREFDGAHAGHDWRAAAWRDAGAQPDVGGGAADSIYLQHGADPLVDPAGLGLYGHHRRRRSQRDPSEHTGGTSEYRNHSRRTPDGAQRSCRGGVALLLPRFLHRGACRNHRPHLLHAAASRVRAAVRAIASVLGGDSRSHRYRVARQRLRI